MAKALVIRETGKKLYVYQIVIVGAGANGSHFFRNLLQMIRTYWDKQQHTSEVANFDVDITLVDADRYEAKNLGNQLCSVEDIGIEKCVALADRYGEHYGIEIKRVPEYVKSLEMLSRLFPRLKEEDDSRVQVIKILVGMVDNNKTRQLFDAYFHAEEVKDLIYLDAGVTGVAVLDKPESAFTNEDWKLVQSSGFGGQVGVGVKISGQVVLDPIGRVYRNILEDAHSAFPDESCAELIINNPQRCMTNQLAAQLASVYMNNLLHTGSIFTHYVDFHAQYGGSRPTFVTDEAIKRVQLLMSK